MPKLVYLESPFAGDIKKNIKYARACMADSLKRGEAPFASHLLYTQKGILNDDISKERELGINAGFCWAEFADLIVFYTDLGMSKGMEAGIERAKKTGQPLEYRALGDGWRG